MARHRSEHPTNAELAILRILRTKGPGTVAQVRDGLEGSRDIGYTTVLKTLQIVTEKGLVRRNEKERSHVYRAAATEEAPRNGASCAISSRGHSAVRRPSSCCAASRNRPRPAN
jgi:predicted transcriptional regulator